MSRLCAFTRCAPSMQRQAHGRTHVHTSSPQCSLMVHATSFAPRSLRKPVSACRAPHCRRGPALRSARLAGEAPRAAGLRCALQLWSARMALAPRCWRLFLRLCLRWRSGRRARRVSCAVWRNFGQRAITRRWRSDRRCLSRRASCPPSSESSRSGCALAHPRPLPLPPALTPPLLASRSCAHSSSASAPAWAARSPARAWWRCCRWAGPARRRAGQRSPRRASPAAWTSPGGRGPAAAQSTAPAWCRCARSPVCESRGSLDPTGTGRRCGPACLPLWLTPVLPSLLGRAVRVRGQRLRARGPAPQRRGDLPCCSCV